MKRILLVDDNDAFRQPLREILRAAGYEVRTAPEGKVALQLFRQRPFDLVVTDLIMPEKEGLETIMELKQIEPGLKIIAMSGGGRVDAGDYLPMAEMLGASATLAKPFEVEKILELIARVLGEM